MNESVMVKSKQLNYELLVSQKKYSSSNQYFGKDKGWIHIKLVSFERGRANSNFVFVVSFEKFVAKDIEQNIRVMLGTNNNSVVMRILVLV